MALTSSEVKEIEVLVRKEIKNFMTVNTIKQFEDKLMDQIAKEIKRGKLEGDIKEITLKMFREFYQFMWMNRSYWEPRLKNFLITCIILSWCFWCFLSTSQYFTPFRFELLVVLL